MRSPPGYEVIPLTPRELALQLEKGNPLIVEVAYQSIMVGDPYGMLGEKQSILDYAVKNTSIKAPI